MYQYSESMLKHLPEKSLKVVQYDLLYSQKAAVLPNYQDRRSHYDLTATKTTKRSVAADASFRDREARFRNQLKNKYVYRVPLKYIYDLGNINFPTKIDMKIRLTLETDIKMLFESDANLNSGLKSGKSSTSTDPTDYNIAVSGIPDAQIVLIKASMIQYEQIMLNTNFRHYLETILYSAKTLGMGVQKKPYQKTYELQAGSQDFTVDFQGANRQFDWIEISLVYDKSDKHLSPYDSYNLETAAKLIKTIDFANISNENSATNSLRYDLDNDLHKHLFYKQFLAWNTNGCSAAPLADFMNNPVAQELKNETHYFANDSDERIYVDLRQAKGYTREIEKPERNDSKMTITIETRQSLSKKMRLRIWGYTNGKYMYLLNGSLTLKYKTYTLKSKCEELES